MAVANGKRPAGAKKAPAKKAPAKKDTERKTTSKGTAAKKKPAMVIRNNKTFRNGLLGVGLIVLCLVILLCLLSGSKAVALEFIRTEFNGYFGAMRFPVLLFLFLTGIKIAFGDHFPVRGTAFVTMSLLLLSIATLLQVFQKDVTGWALEQKGWTPNYKGYLWYAYDTSSLTPTGGGVVGELLGYPLGKVLDIVASALVLFFAIGAFTVSLIRTWRPDAGARMSDWIAQFSSDFKEWRAERDAQKGRTGADRDPDGAILVPIPDDLRQMPTKQGEPYPASPPSAWQRTARVLSKIGNFFAPVVTSQVPPDEFIDEGRPSQNPPPNERPMQQRQPQMATQIPAQINTVHAQPPTQIPLQKIHQRAPAGRPMQALQAMQAMQGKRPSLYIEDIITREKYEDSNGVEFSHKGRDERPHLKTVPPPKKPEQKGPEQKEYKFPDFLAKRMAQYENEADTIEEVVVEETPHHSVIEEIYTFATDEQASPSMEDSAMLGKPEGAEAIEMENEPWETMESDYEPDDDMSRPFRRRRTRPDPLDAQPKLDPSTRLDRPDWKPAEQAPDVPHAGFVEEIEEYRQPPFSLLLKQDKKSSPDTRLQDAAGAQKLEETLASFGVDARVTKVVHGPAITRYELQPAPGVKVSKIVNLTDDIALNMAAIGVRIEAPIPGKAAIGIEIANDEIETVHLRDVLESEESLNHPSRLAVALGKDVAGKRIIGDLARMPHLLIAGATGSGKSVCINTLITSIIYRANPEEVRLIMIDPKKVELSLYNGIPHLLVPVVTDPKKASGALSWAVMEMEERYRLFSEVGVRDIRSYNAQRSEGTPLLPQIVIIIDELSDLMLVAPGEVEESIYRLAQLARACGMHLVIATQRPSVNVITGTIKANIPGRIAFAVSSQVDSRTILDTAGAEKLLGKGDMLYAPTGGGKPLRVQGCFISDDEVHRVVEYVKDRNTVDYSQAVIDALNVQGEEETHEENSNNFVDDALFVQAVEMAVESGQASISMLQRRLRVGYARAGRLIDEMSKRNIIGPADGAKPREVLITREDFMLMYKK